MCVKMLHSHRYFAAAWVAAFLCFASTAHAAIEVKTAPIAHEVSVWYAPAAVVPVVDIQIAFEGAGYSSDSSDKAGRAVLAGLMLTQGAGDLDSLAFQRALDDGAIELSAHTDADRLTIHIHCLRDQAPRAGALLAMALVHPRFEETDLARMKNQLHVQLQELQESPDYLAEQLFIKHAFPNHPYANDPYGTDASINRLKPEDLRQYLNMYVTRKNMRIAAAGDVDAALLEATLKPVIEASGAGDAPAPIAPVSMQGSGTELRAHLPVPQTVVHFTAPAVPRNDPKFYAVYLLDYILGGHDLTSRLMTAVRQEKGLAYSVTSDLDLLTGATLLRGELATRNASTDDAIAAVKQTLSELHDKGVTEEECKDAKSYVIGSRTIELDNSRAISNMLLSMQINHLGADYLDKRTAYFTSVSCADMNAAAKALLDPSRFFFTIVGGASTNTAVKAKP